MVVGSPLITAVIALE